MSKSIRLFLVFSHKLTELQKKSAIDYLKVDEFIYLPEPLQRVWSSIDPNKEEITQDIIEILDYLKVNATSDDKILVQGDFGSTYFLVRSLKDFGYDCYYSTTERKSTEYNINGSILKVSNFTHVRYRKYL